MNHPCNNQYKFVIKSKKKHNKIKKTKNKKKSRPRQLKAISQIYKTDYFSNFLLLDFENRQQL